jgi:lactoylglutathione lyase
MVNFYRDILGFPIKFGLQDRDGVTFGYYFDLGNSSFIEIFDHQLSAREWNLPTDTIERPAVTHYAHFCLECDNLEKLKAIWEAKGVKLTAIVVGKDYSRQMWTHDPDGNAIEIMEYTPDSLQLK